jgi:hypothetical protein
LALTNHALAFAADAHPAQVTLPLKVILIRVQSGNAAGGILQARHGWRRHLYAALFLLCCKSIMQDTGARE